MKPIIYFVIALLLISCSRSGNTKNASSSLNSETIKSLEVNTLTNKDSLNISVLSIKERYRGYSSSTVLNEAEIMGFYRRDTSGFFGSYILVDSNSMEMHGTLIIFNRGIPQNWRYDNPDDLFITLDYQKGDLVFFNGIHIGMDINELNEKIADKITNNQDSIIQAYMYNYAVDFYVANDKISGIKITKNDK